MLFRSGKSALFDNDEEINKVWESQYSLEEFTAPTNFKSYDELKTRLDAVLSGTTKVGKVTDDLEDRPVAPPKVDTTPSPAPAMETKSVEAPVVAEDDDTMAYFEKLAN